ncbi:hypothetical protein HKX41_11975, partial [Salinisphaera sp. USBA-960]|nr:hypothetical protein [Salifodinibacter halophilus]
AGDAAQRLATQPHRHRPDGTAADTRLDRVETLSTPRDRSGTVVRFSIEKIRAAVLILRDAAGAPLPLGSAVLSGNGERATVGYDGET